MDIVIYRENIMNKDISQKSDKKRSLLGVTSAVISFTLIITGFIIYAFAVSCPHEWSEGAVIQDPTCSNEGSTQYVCLLCDNVKTETMPAIEHDIVTEIKKAVTCSEDGEEITYCKNCSFSSINVITATGEHDFTESIIEEPTCNKEGIAERSCTVCGETETSTIEKTAHTIKHTVIKEATCQTQGEQIGVCTVCNYTSGTEPTPLGDHFFEETLTPASCKSEGLLIKRCIICDFYEEEILPVSDHEYTVLSQTPATCEKDGSTLYICYSCSHSYTETSDATGHNWNEATCTGPKQCSVCFKTEGEALGHTTDSGICDRCGQSFESDKTEESDTENGETTEDTEAETESDTAAAPEDSN